MLIKKIYPPSSHFIAHIREHSIMKVPSDTMRDMLQNYFCQITKMQNRAPRYLHARRFSPGASEDPVWCSTETINVDELEIYLHLRKLTLSIALSNCYGRRQTPYGDILTFFRP